MGNLYLLSISIFYDIYYIYLFILNMHVYYILYTMHLYVVYALHNYTQTCILYDILFSSVSLKSLGLQQFTEITLTLNLRGW